MRHDVCAGICFFIVSVVAEANYFGIAHAKTLTGPHDSSKDSCGYCHIAPPSEKQNSPLWSSMAISDYAIFQVKPIATGQPQGISLLCLSCHDGTVSDGPTLIKSATATTEDIDRFVLQIGADGLANDHPNSISYGLAQDRGLHAPENGMVGNLPLYSGAKGGSAPDQIECTTCHDPHGGTFKSYLRMDNARSNLCLTCHDK